MQARGHACAVLPLRAVSTSLGSLTGSCELLGVLLLPSSGAPPAALACVALGRHQAESAAQPQRSGFWSQHLPLTPGSPHALTTALHCQGPLYSLFHHSCRLPSPHTSHPSSWVSDPQAPLLQEAFPTAPGANSCLFGTQDSDRVCLSQGLC